MGPRAGLDRCRISCPHWDLIPNADIQVTKTVTEVYVFVNWIIQEINECEPMDYSK